MLSEDVKAMPFDWVESITKEMAVVINCSLEPVALNYIAQNQAVQLAETVLKACKIGEHRELIGRCVNILAKVAKVELSLDQIINSKTIIITCLINYAGDDDLAK